MRNRHRIAPTTLRLGTHLTVLALALVVPASRPAIGSPTPDPFFEEADDTPDVVACIFSHSTFPFEVVIQGDSLAGTDTVRETLLRDLELSGIFSRLRLGDREPAHGDFRTGDIDFLGWRLEGADLLVLGELRIADGAGRLELRALDVASTQQIEGRLYADLPVDQRRMAAHDFANHPLAGLDRTLRRLRNPDRLHDGPGAPRPEGDLGRRRRRSPVSIPSLETRA